MAVKTKNVCAHISFCTSCPATHVTAQKQREQSKEGGTETKMTNGCRDNGKCKHVQWLCILVVNGNKCIHTKHQSHMLWVTTRAASQYCWISWRPSCYYVTTAYNLGKCNNWQRPTWSIGVGAEGYRGIDRLLVNMGDNHPTFRLNYVHKLCNNVAAEAI